MSGKCIDMVDRLRHIGDMQVHRRKASETLGLLLNIVIRRCMCLLYEQSSTGMGLNFDLVIPT